MAKHPSSDARRGAPAGAIAISVLTALLALLAPGPVDAGCPGSQLLDATFSYLVSNPSWGGAGGDGRCGRNGCYATESDPPVSPRMKGVYWSVGTGNPVIGVGNDSGLFSGGFGPGLFWLKQVSSESAYGTGTPFTGGLYHYPAWVSLKLSPPYVTGPPVTWSSPDADGCGPLNPPSTVCTCMLLTDEWSDVGYFATLSARSDQLGNTNIDPGQTIRLAPIPRPRIVRSFRVNGGTDVVVSVGLSSDALPDTPAEGVYSKDGCPSCLGGFRVFGAVVSRTSSPPPQSAYVELPRADGTPQGDTPFLTTVDIGADCDPLVENVMYLAIQLVGEGAAPFRTGVVSQASTRIHCGDLATPDRRRGDDPRRDRGRDRR